MSSPVSSLLANIFFDSLENKISTANKTLKGDTLH